MRGRHLFVNDFNDATLSTIFGTYRYPPLKEKMRYIPFGMYFLVCVYIYIYLVIKVYNIEQIRHGGGFEASTFASTFASTPPKRYT